MHPFFHFLVIAATTCAGLAQSEPFRPAFHFTPEKNWMNDPNGMVFFEDEWHLFYQYNPHGNTWGHMSWGHAVSRDLVRWKHLPLALAEEDGVMIFSGSAVVDWKNTSDFGKDGKPPLVAIYTGHREGRQDQRLAFSNDRGRTWTKFAGNPVLDVKMADFRDPKVFWHDATSRWVMVVALSAEKKVHFYASPNLKEWKYVGEFGPAGATGGLWECPDLFSLTVEDDQGRKPGEPIRNQKWVLIVNINPGGPAGGSGTQYFVGEFDGARFTAEPARPAGEDALWADFGADFYAGVSWSDVPKDDGRRVWLGWMSNWQYAEKIPTSPWRSAMSVPRELKLRRTADGLRLVQQPAAELEALRQNAPQKFPGGSFAEVSDWLSTISDLPMLLDVEMTFGDVAKDSSIGIHIDTAKNQSTSVTIDARRRRLVVDRTRSGQTAFHPNFAAKHEAPLRITNGSCTVHLLLDRSSLEVFAQNGETVLTELIFPQAGHRKLRLTVEGTPPSVEDVAIYRLE